MYVATCCCKVLLAQHVMEDLGADPGQAEAQLGELCQTSVAAAHTQYGMALPPSPLLSHHSSHHHPSPQVRGTRQDSWPHSLTPTHSLPLSHSLTHEPCQ